VATFTDDDAPADVLLLGTAHLGNPGRDLINVTVDDMLAPHRQAELEDLAQRLAAFEPTKICVEATPDLQAKVDELYARYLSGETDGQRGEIHQIAFRLAQRIGLDRVIAIDDDSPLEWDELDAFLASHPVEDKLMKKWEAEALAEAEEESADTSRSSVREFLLAMNDPAQLRSDAAWYVDVAGVGPLGEHAGSNMLASWYRRNIGIFSNLSGVTELGDRIFALFGAGHVPILRSLLDLSSRHRLVEPERYLR
jgi:hypothetical protein